MTNDLMEAVVLHWMHWLDPQPSGGVMEEITTALEWLHGQDPPGDDATAKLVSLPKWTTAQDHQRRTMTFAAQAASGGRGTPRRGGAGSWVPASNLGASLRTGLP